MPDADDMDMDIFYNELCKIRNAADELKFKELCIFALNVLSLPHSSACCERVFSKINSIKTKSRKKVL